MKKKTNKKTVLIVIISLMVICLLCGTIGLLESKKSPEDKNTTKKEEYKAAYKYYIDGEEVLEMPELEDTTEPNPDFEGSETTLPKYKFERYTCTNEVTGEFDEEKWEFVPDLTNNTTCRLYFLRTTHEVTIKVSNGKLPNNTLEEKINVELEKDNTINITPNDGYKFEGITCTNETIGEYKEDTKDLKISNVTKDSTCTITFTISDFTAEISVQNGNATENRKSANYGSNIQFEVTPSENYAFNKVTCTNNQKASYADNKITIQGITNNTVCTVEFRPVKLQVKLNVINGTVTSKENPISVSERSSAIFDIKADDGFVLTGADTKCTNSAGTRFEVTGNMFAVYNVTKDMECTVTLKEATN